MHRIELTAAMGSLLFCVAGLAAGQSSGEAVADAEGVAADAAAPDVTAATGSAADRSGERRAIGPSVDECFNSQGMIDISVLDDGHLYVRTRGSNFYLVTTDHCENLEKSFLHRTAYLVPHGRTVCRDDGSHVLYKDAGRQAVCAIRAIERVEDRAEARELAAGSRSLSELEELPAEALPAE